MASDTNKDDNRAGKKDTNNNDPPESLTTPPAQDPTGDSPAPTGQDPTSTTPTEKDSSSAPQTTEEKDPGEAQKLVTGLSDAHAHEPHTTADTTAPAPSETQPTPAPEDASQSTTQPANAQVTEVGESSESRIGESTDRRGSLSIHQQIESSEDAGPSILLVLLLTSGARHPFKLDRKYLKKREVNAPDYNPYSMSVYTLKELILREWRSDWEAAPSSPSAIRLISFGKLLQDKTALSETKLNSNSPNIIHMTIKPQEAMEEEDAKVAKNSGGRDREANESSPSCRCVIL